MNMQILNCKVIHGEFGTYRTGGELRHDGRKSVTEHIDFPKKQKFIF